ncbi:hypothetical protein Godav_008912 [Gossypium davidsonii]|uniref:NADH-ubiquinone oxidoreductase chain 5 n=2 Tax=Gossypium TaxID=3633 RepID=A0A7J8SBG2_GOSDV|nr:hypothetical protein [Gossypium davidsonii]MBA0659001.1 hypothetical protein [Gossypium klotzschianum]
MLSLALFLAPIRILLCKFSKFNDFLISKHQESTRPRGRERRKETMITRSNLAEQLREYQIRSKHDWASVSFFSSTSNLTSSRVDVVVFVIWELVILAFLVFSAVSLYFRHMQLAFILVCITMLLLLCMKITKQVRLARKKKRRMLLPLSM